MLAHVLYNILYSFGFHMLETSVSQKWGQTFINSTIKLILLLGIKICIFKLKFDSTIMQPVPD